MERYEIIKKLSEIIESADKKDGEVLPEITEEMALVKDLGFDSMRMLFTAVLIEETFEITLKNINGQNLQTVGDVVDMIENNMMKGEGSA